MKQEVLVSVDFLRQVEQLLIEFKMDEEYEWGNCRPLEVMEEKKLLPEEVYQIRKILEEAPVFGFTQAHTSDKQLHHYALVLRDLDKTVDGWCEEPEFYLDGERVYAEQSMMRFVKP